MMADHVCDWWKIRTDGLVAEAVCRDGCTASITEILQKANAAERLIVAMKKPVTRGRKTTIQMCKLLDGWIDMLEGQ